MTGLWADGWFYISSAGLLVSGVLFFFLLGQYRGACEAADITDNESDAAAAAVSPVFVHDEPAAAPIASIAAEKSAARAETLPPREPEPAVGGPKTEPERRKDSAVTTGGLSPAVVYLQNIKSELAELHQEMRALATRVDAELGAVSTRDEALIERLGELARVVESLKTVVAGASGPEPVVGVISPVPQAAPEPQSEPSPDPIRLELSAAIDAQQTPQPAASAPEEKTRRGPVWPV